MVSVRGVARAAVVAAMALLAVGPVRAGVIPSSDGFDGTMLQAFWTIESPNTASSVGLTGGGALRMFASQANGGSDLAGTNMNAPRIYQGVGPWTDWVIETKFDFSPTTDYQGAGILLVTAGGEYWRMAERAYGNGWSGIRSVGGYVNTGATTSWLKVQKAGSDYTGWWSTDGTNWTLGGTYSNATPISQFGLFTIRQPWSGSTNSTADFDYFMATPEPATMSLLALGGLAVLGRRRRK